MPAILRRLQQLHVSAQSSFTERGRVCVCAWERGSLAGVAGQKWSQPGVSQGGDLLDLSLISNTFSSFLLHHTRTVFSAFSTYWIIIFHLSQAVILSDILSCHFQPHSLCIFFLFQVNIGETIRNDEGKEPGARFEPRSLLHGLKPLFMWCTDFTTKQPAPLIYHCHACTPENFYWISCSQP